MTDTDSCPRPPAEPLTIRVAVGSGNPCKIEAVRRAFEEVFAKSAAGNDGQRRTVHIAISSHSVPSGVADQPFGDEETRLGAMHRAQNAYDAACANSESEDDRPDFAVGLEGGLEKLRHPQFDATTKDEGGGAAEELWCMAWMAILGSRGSACLAAKAGGDNFASDAHNETDQCWGYAKTGSFLLPPALCDLVINQGMELGHADDRVFQRVNSKHGEGTVGQLTDGEIDRTEYYVHALKLALIPWIRPELYL